MMTLPRPSCSPREALDACIEGISLNGLRSRLLANLHELVNIASVYETKGLDGCLFEISPPHQSLLSSPIVGSLTKDDLIKVYNQYFVPSKKPAGNIYNNIKVSAKEKCPYCGGIGQPKTLDHYLPKAHFPQFSVVPLNLVPSCSDCNQSEKGHTYASKIEEQVLHPYLDPDYFFTERWVSARLSREEPYSLLYYVTPPAEWTEFDKERVKTHFRDFKLASRYSVQAAVEIETLLGHRKRILRNFSANEFAEYLLEAEQCLLPVNHWKRVMYACLADDTWFCAKKF